jgi:hypothetical protein
MCEVPASATFPLPGLDMLESMVLDSVRTICPEEWRVK